jgi:hypothetical protein
MKIVAQIVEPYQRAKGLVASANVNIVMDDGKTVIRLRGFKIVQRRGSDGFNVWFPTIFNARENEWVCAFDLNDELREQILAGIDSAYGEHVARIREKQLAACMN